MREAVEAGLSRVDALVPGTGYAEVTAGARGEGTSVVGYVRGEVGAKPTKNVSLFGFGEATVNDRLTPGWMLGVGTRVTW